MVGPSFAPPVVRSTRLRLAPLTTGNDAHHFVNIVLSNPNFYPPIYQRRKRDGTRAKIFTTDIWIGGKKFPRSTGRTTRREAEKRAVEIEAEIRTDLARKHEP